MNRRKLIAIVAIVAMVAIALQRRRGSASDPIEELEDPVEDLEN